MHFYVPFFSPKVFVLQIYSLPSALVFTKKQQSMEPTRVEEEFLREIVAASKVNGWIYKVIRGRGASASTVQELSGKET